MSAERRGPLSGQPLPMHGGQPGQAGCNGCIDCCHLPEISITDDEADRLGQIYRTFEEPLGSLIMERDHAHQGWQIMTGPCVFRRYDHPLTAGGCRIYGDRPASCMIFTCRLLLELRRSDASPSTQQDSPSPVR